ncbi:T9SS type B sorting domain-containing protein [Flavobacterium sp.]|uniref:T9SS type B sorting domain-containing protein n=1 Tax=Flavobacterium sp. TaxID=239 RepID=UPI002B4ACFBF|nr:T9SS type B sorting domain-containing protein [Flavobacterium sp.]HLF52017.1 T9SS type B sorting domain-containing protein [Flavobacterium sp.]
MKKTIQILLFLFSITAFSQFSKTHYIPPLSNSDSQAPQGQFMYISCPSLTPVNFKIFELGGSIIIGTVSRDNPYILNIGAGFNTQLLVSRINVSSVRNDKGYIVEAEDLVYVTVRLIATPQNYQAGGLVSKGLAALGTQFRIGAFVNTGVANTSNNHYTFASILATENNTTVSFNDIKIGVSLINNTGAGNTPGSITLNRGESYVFAVEGPNNANRDGLIGASITATKPIAVNCGSFAGSNGTTSNLDLGFDQIVSAERTGTDYIFIKGNGPNATERPLIVANENNTDVFVNGNTTPFITLNAGEYVAFDGSQFSSVGNLYVSASKNVFAYQGIGGTNDQANQNMHFVPPLSCETPKIINNIPFINEVGSNSSFTGTVCIVTETGADLNFIINGISYPLASLPSNITVNGPLNVLGNSGFVTYTFQGLTGNISVFSTKQVYLSYFGSSGAATYGGFYSGFTFKPEVTFQPLDITQINCIPNIELNVNTLSAFDTFQWYFNDLPITGATSGNYTPTQPGYYFVSAAITVCGTILNSDKIPVSDCPTNSDNDLANDNIDLDLDNDGLPNCLESYGNSNIDISNASAGNITVGNYSNSFTGTITTDGTGTPLGTFNGIANGTFITEVPIGKGNSVTYQMNFAQPISVALEYVTTANASDLINSDADFIVKSPINKTITVLNPSNQLLIDTNYDGIYESGITEYSSFEIRFRVNSSIPLAAGTGTFSFRSHLTTSFSFTQKNLSDASINKATFSIFASCVPKDNDSDGVPDQLDLDSENDGILDNTEFTSQNYIPISNIDVNQNGLDDAYEVTIIASDADLDGVADYYDLDSDNDGIYDLAESGSNAIDANYDGIIDGNQVSFGINGLSNSLETTTDNGILNYTISNTDSDGLANYVDLDSDNDSCSDVIEAGFTDGNNDSHLGNIPATVNASGMVTNGTNGYTPPNNNYITAAPISITTQPTDQTQCELQNATFTISSTLVDGYQWQVSTDGITWTNLSDNATYSGTTTISLQITSVSPVMNGYKYRLILSKNGNSCGLTSDFATLNTFALPAITSPVTLVQCDDDSDGISNINLTAKNSFISANYLNETFTYYTTSTGANTADSSVLIATPTVYSSANGVVWVRIENANNCFTVAQLNLVVSATQINASFHRSFTVCDDYLDAGNDDTDGVSEFNFSSVTADIESILPPPSSLYTIKYYKNEPDASAEINEITNISNYRNVTLNQQDIWVRVDSNIDNACFGLGAYVTLTVEALPVAHLIADFKMCDDNNDGTFTFNTSTLQSNLLQGQTNVTATYLDQNNLPLPSPFPNTFTTASQTIQARVTNNNTNTVNGIPCYDEVMINFIVDASPVADPEVFITACDDNNPSDTDGLNSFDTTLIESNILNGQIGMVVKYFDSNGNPLTSPLPNPFITATQNVTVTIENPLNTICVATSTLHFVANPLPNIALEHNELVCTNLPDIFVTLTAGIQDGTPESNYAYIWTKDGIVIPGVTTSSLDVNTEGVYTVEVITAFGCSRIRTITVVASDIAHFSVATIVDLSDVNTVTVNVTGQGDYVYSMDYTNVFQDSNVFTNVAAGIHEVFVKDLNDCGMVSQIISVIGAPPYFTPNGDGFNDTWNIKGVSTEFNYNSTIYIFDRYGKLLKQIGTTGNGWDGTLNDQPMPSADYWYAVYLEDGRIAKGHFALKR